MNVNGFTNQVSFSSGSPCCVNFITQYLVNLMSPGNPYVVATCPAGACNNLINLKATTSGSNTNYPVSTSYTFDSVNFAGPSFTATPSGATLTGGTDGSTVWDSGTVTVSVGSGFTASAPYSQSGNNSAALVATALAGTGPTGLNRSGSPVQAVASGSTITLTFNSVGVAGNVTVSVTSSPANSSWFPGGSFSGSVTLASGQDSYPSGLAHP